MLRLLLAAAVASLAPAALAQTCTTSWTNPAGGTWEITTNWDNGIPTSTSTACITLDGTYTVAQSSADRTIAGLVVGGASGTQTLTVFNRFLVTGNSFVRPNGRMELLDRVPGGEDGLLTTGTITVEGVLVQNSGTTLLGSAGILDVAPGGTLRVVGNGVRAGGASALFRVRGTVEAVGCPLTTDLGNCQVTAPLDVQGGTIRAAGGVLFLTGGGTLADATLDATATGSLFFRPGLFTVTGTLSGSPVGTVTVADARFAAGPGNATLALAGSGLVFSGASGVQFSAITSAGGRFVNTGLLTWASAFAIAQNVVIENRGTLRSTGGVSLVQGARLLNRPGATFEIAGSSAIGFGDGTIENAGLLVKTSAGSTGFGNQSASQRGRLRNIAGAEVRALNGRIDLAVPGSQTVPDGATLTGTAQFFLPTGLEVEGTISPGTPEQPVATLAILDSYRPSLVAGSPRLVIDVDAGGQSDVLAVQPFSTTRLGGALIVRVRPGYVPAVGDQWTVLTNGTSAITGQFSQVVAEGAPSGIAFVAEVAPGGASLVVRAVAVAPGGPVTVSATRVVGGSVRPVFLSGPGAGGVSSARLECTACFDAAAFGTIPAQIVGEGALREARFDLTSPRAFGLYDLVLTQPGLADVRVPLTVRPFLGFALTDGGVARGARVRPPGQGYNYSTMRMELRTNADAPAYHTPRITRRDSTLYALAVATGNPFSTGVVFYESDAQADPARHPLVFGRLLPTERTSLTYGLRVSPENVRFPEQTPTGPDDPRIPFGQPRLTAVAGAQHLSAARMATAAATALRGSSSAALSAYLAQVDAADPAAALAATQTALEFGARGYYAPPGGLLGRIVTLLDAAAPAPAGLASAAAEPFGVAFEAAAEAVGFEAEAVLTEAVTGGGALGALVDAEVAALFPEGTGRTNSAGRLGPEFFGDDASRTTYSALERLLCSFGFGESIRSIKGIPGAKSGGGGGTSCDPPAAPADPNDKLTAVGGLCEFGTVTVDGEEQTRCVRHFVPLAEATLPLFYTITFENLPQATANAEFVTITDVLDPNLDPATLDVLATSSDSTFSVERVGQTLTFRFVGIDLPPNRTAPEGEGFVSFAVRPRAGLAEATEIRNTARIVFDFNPPIQTPEIVHELRRTLDLGVALVGPSRAEVGQPTAFQMVAANLRGDPAAEATFTLAAPGAAISDVTPSRGTCEGSGPVVCTVTDLDADDELAIDFVVTPQSADEVLVSARVATPAFDAFEPNNTDGLRLMVTPVSGEESPGALAELTLAAPAPNPARGSVAVRWGLPAAGPASVRVFDLLGRSVATLADEPLAAAGWHEARLDTRALASGVYVVRVEAAGEVRTRRIVVVR